MTTKHETKGVFTVLGRAADESLDLASSLREGKLTRRQFGAWYEKRRAEGAGIVVTLREKAAELAKPVGETISHGETMLMSMAPRIAKRPARRRRTLRKAAKRAR